jgi:hypothetical protein
VSTPGRPRWYNGEVATRLDAISDVLPRVLRSGEPTTVEVRWRLPAASGIEVAVLPMETHRLEEVTVSSGADRISIRFTPRGEQEYAVLLTDRESGRLLAEARLYALEADWFALRPFKGDLHLHSNRSDGREEPAFVAAASRQIGMDFMAVTDHGSYEPSLEAMAAFEGSGTGLLILPGEEIHPPDNPVHSLGIGGRRSVNARFRDAGYRAQVAAIERELDAKVAPADRYPVASCIWSHRAVREAGGLSVFCHPYWVHRHRYDVPTSVTEALLALRPFDALELIGGYHPAELESNALQVSRYREECARGAPLPIVGVSDSHGCEGAELFGWYYTIVLAGRLGFDDLAEAIRSGRSAAVEAVPGESVRAHGAFRLAKYCQFLIREVFPGHDELCAVEGTLMKEMLAGAASARSDLERIRGGVDRYYGRVFGPPDGEGGAA